MKLRCPQCSTVVDAVSDPIRCPNCGFTAPLPKPATPTATAGPSQAPAPTMSPYSSAPPPASYGQPTPYGVQTYGSSPPVPSVYGGARPVGKQRSAVAVVIFSIITFGIYAYVWEWKISKEMDRFTGDVKHKILRTGIIVALLGMLVLVVGAAALYTAGVFDPSFDPEADTGAAPALLGGFVLMLAGFVLILVGAVMMIMGLYRVWSNLEKDDRMRGEAKPTNATLLLVLMILGFVIPYVGFVILMTVYGLTQSALNRTWKVYGSPPPPQAYAGSAPA